MFHAHNGLYFERQADGMVRVRMEKEHGLAFEVLVPADTWASVVASVSARGETLDTWSEARQYHNRPPIREGAA